MLKRTTKCSKAELENYDTVQYMLDHCLFVDLLGLAYWANRAVSFQKKLTGKPWAAIAFFIGAKITITFLALPPFPWNCR